MTQHRMAQTWGIVGWSSLFFGALVGAAAVRELDCEALTEDEVEDEALDLRFPPAVGAETSRRDISQQKLWALGSQGG